MAGKHRKPRGRASVITLAAAGTKWAALTAVGGVIAASAAASAAPVHGLPQSAALGTVAYTTTTPAQKTCAAVAAWERHPTTRNLRTVVHYNGHTRGYLHDDVTQLVSDARASHPRYPVPDDEQYVGWDCDNGYGL